jgi:hypothetical protein
VTAAGGWAYSRTVCTLWTRPFPDSRTPKESKARRDSKQKRRRAQLNRGVQIFAYALADSSQTGLGDTCKAIGHDSYLR